MSTAQVPPTPVNVAETLTDSDNDFHDGNGWKLAITATGNVVSIEVEPLDGDGDPVDPVHFRAIVVEGKTPPVLLAGPAYISGNGDGYLYLRCNGCDEIITCVDAGNSLAGLNAEAAEHTCPPSEEAAAR